MANKIYRQDAEGWAYGITAAGDLFVGNINDRAGRSTMYYTDTTVNRERAERYWEANSFAKEIKVK